MPTPCRKGPSPKRGSPRPRRTLHGHTPVESHALPPLGLVRLRCRRPDRETLAALGGVLGIARTMAGGWGGPARWRRRAARRPPPVARTPRLVPSARNLLRRGPLITTASGAQPARSIDPAAIASAH